MVLYKMANMTNLTNKEIARKVEGPENMSRQQLEN